MTSPRVTPDALLSLPGHAAWAHRAPGLMHWLERNADRFAGADAVGGIGRDFLSHTALRDQIRQGAESLTLAGIGRGDVVAIMLPNGPEALTAILAACCAGVAFPNPADEPLEYLQSLLDEVPVKALIFAAERPGALPDFCARHGILPLALHTDTRGPAGRFSLEYEVGAMPAMETTRSDDACILARTAGTTGTPRLIAWSQISLAASADAAARWMSLDDTDRSLCVMPFASLHSLVRSCLPSLLAGGSVVCCPGFDKVRIADWIDRHAPTFITAVPGIFRTMLNQPDRYGQGTPAASLRFLATGSDRLDEATAEAVRRTFGVPVREFYGMNEVAPMLAATPAGRHPQLDGAIGPAMAPWTLACRDETGAVVGPGVEGEIAVRGGLFNPVVTQRDRGTGRLVDGWYLTGDSGYIDAEGLLHVTGRIDDRINRGGKKIAPEAVEALLRECPGVAQAVIFPVPDPVLGQRVAALVVPAGGGSPDEAVLRAFVADRLPDYMVPERIVSADRLPYTDAGKISRKGLADRLGLTSPASAPGAGVSPTTISASEAALLELVRSLLGDDTLQADDEFAAVGGDSFFATALLVAIEERFGILPTPGQFIAHGSTKALAQLIDSLSTRAQTPLISLIQEGDGTPPLFFAHSADGHAYYALTVARHMGAEQTVYAFQYPETGHSDSLEDHAARYVLAMRDIQPHGPYCLAGHSFGAQLAFEAARQLTRTGEHVAFLALLDDEADLFKRKPGIATRVPPDTIQARCRHMLDSYVPGHYPGDISLYIATIHPVEYLADPTLGWGDLAIGQVTVRQVPGNHTSMMSDANAAIWAGALKTHLRQSLAAPPKGWALRRARAEAMAKRPDAAATTAARWFAKAGHRNREIDAYRHAIAHLPDQPYWVYRNLGNALLERGDIEAGIACLREAATREARPVIGHALLAESLHGLGRTRDALAAMQHAETQAGDASQAFAQLAASWLTIDEAGEAVRTARRALELNPENPQAMTTLAMAWANRGENDPAIAMARQAIETAANHAGLYHLLGTLLAERGELAEAETNLRRALEIDAGQIWARHELGRVIERLGRRDDALTIAREAVQLAPEEAGLLHRLGALLNQRGDHAEAEAILRRAIARKPDHVWAHHELGVALGGQGQDEEATEAARHAVMLAPGHAGLRHRLGLLLNAGGHLAEAEATLRHAVELDHRHAWARHELSLVLEKQGRLDEAIEMARRARELAPHNAGLDGRLASLLAKLRDMDTAG